MIDIKKNGGFYYIKENHGTSLISEETYLAIQAQNQQLQQYKSIVKAVDPDNLPECDIFAVVDGELLKGDLELINNEIVGFFDKGHHKTGITHYIETKNIIKMMEDL